MTIERAIKITKEFRNNLKDITPEFVGKMKISLYSIREGYNVYIEVNGQNYKLSRLETFFRNFIANNKITLKDYVIQEDYVFTSIGLVTKKEFEEAQKVVEDNSYDENDIISPRNLIDREIYQLSDGRIVYHVGIFLKNTDVFYFSSSSNTLSLYKESSDDTRRYFVELKKNKNDEYEPYRIYPRKTKDVVVKQLFISFNEEEIEAYIMKRIHRYELFSTANSKDIGKKEICLNKDLKYSFNYSLAERDGEYYFVTSSTWNKELYKITDYNLFKKAFSKFRNNSETSLPLMEFVENDKEQNFNNLKSIAYFYERG